MDGCTAANRKSKQHLCSCVLERCPRAGGSARRRFRAPVAASAGLLRYQLGALVLVLVVAVVVELVVVAAVVVLELVVVWW